MHIFFLNNLKNQLGENPAQDQTNDTLPIEIRLLYEEFFLKNWCVLIKKSPVTIKETNKKWPKKWLKTL